MKKGMIEAKEEQKPQYDSQIFTQQLPLIGKIPMSKNSLHWLMIVNIAFYIPRSENNPMYDELQDKIKRNGGLVVDQHECMSYQIKPD